MECQINKNVESCPCTYPGCFRRGKCCDCIKYHKGRDELPACFFSEETEKSYDRSIQKFIEDNK